MARLFVVLLWSVVSQFLLLAASRDGLLAPPITIYTTFKGDPCPDVAIEAMKGELASIMGPMGLRFEWRSLDRADMYEVSVELVVVTFRGNCDREEEDGDAESGPLGWTHISDGAILPFCDIHTARVRKLIDPFLSSVRGNEFEARFGRALGRVLAHELFHVFANTTHHGSWGVAKPFYTGRELISSSFRFEAKETKLLRIKKDRTLLKQGQGGFGAAAGQ